MKEPIARESNHYPTEDFGSKGIRDFTLWIQVPPKKVLEPPNCTLSAFRAATWIHRVNTPTQQIQLLGCPWKLDKLVRIARKLIYFTYLLDENNLLI